MMHHTTESSAVRHIRPGGSTFRLLLLYVGLCVCVTRRVRVAVCLTCASRVCVCVCVLSLIHI